jgi:hypothetical protein
MTRSLLRLLPLLLAAGLLRWGAAAALPAADPAAPAEITISHQVVVTGVEPLGVNLTPLAGGTNLASNNLIRGSGMEPAVARYLVRIERSGPGWIEWDHSLGGIHMWEQNATGFGDGAAVRLYRLVDRAGQPLSYAGGSDLNDSSAADHVVFLGETRVPAGGWVAQGASAGAVNRVSLEDASLQLAYGDYALLTVTKTRLLQSEVNPRLHPWFVDQANLFWLPDGAAAELVPHPGALPPEFTGPGETCLQVTLPAGGGWIGQYLFHAYDQGEGQWYSQLEPGAPYRLSVWLRQAGLPGGAVSFQANGPYASLSQPAPWTVTGEWQRYTYDFTGPPYPQQPGHAGLGLAAAGPGTLWIDNFIVYRSDAVQDFAPFTPHHLALDELLAALPSTGPKPAVRFYPTTYPTHSPMTALLSNYASSRIDFIYNLQPADAQLTIPQAMHWALATGSSPATRVIPHLTLSEEYTEVEWLQLVEYLGVPYDPAVDDPQTRPWAYLRYQQRGSGIPWTDEFRQVVLEFGNETWHQGAGGFGWDGFGRPLWVHQGGREYGLFARYYFVEHLAAQPWWSAYHLGSKIRFALNANYDGSTGAYGELAARQAPTLPLYLGHANYVGPKWETGETPHQVFDDHGMQETLVAAYTGMYGLIDQVAATRAQLQAAGLASYDPIAYEGGPSGYYVPGQGTITQTAVSQLYGKSLGMGVAALDAWLYSSLHGYRHQEFFAFAGGDNWSSHTMPLAGGFRRQSGWLALMLRNRYASGSAMLHTSFESLPSYTREGQAVPLMAAYTLSDTHSLSLFLLSRKLDGVHDGVDFGSGVTPVTVRFPPASCTALTRYALTAPDGSPADPRGNNLDAENLAITSVALDPALCATGELLVGPATGGVSGGMPPGTVYLYRFNLAHNVRHLYLPLAPRR